MTTMTTMTYKQWDAHTTELQNRHGYTAKPAPPRAGRLAKVSVYEFVNDWLPPQLAGKIMSYAVSSPHKEGITKALDYRRIMVNVGQRKNYWLDYDQRPRVMPGDPRQQYRHNTRVRYAPDDTKTERWWRLQPVHTPYTELLLYRQINTPYLPSIDNWEEKEEGEWGNRGNVAHNSYVKNGRRSRRKNNCLRMVNNKVVYKYDELTMLELKYVNKVVEDLWDINRRPLHGKYAIPNILLKTWLCENKVPGRSKLSLGETGLERALGGQGARRPAITALIKV